MLQKNTLLEETRPTFTFDDRHWRVRGLEKQLSCERMKVNLMVSRRELVHVDTLDLYVARQRRMFIKEAAGELYCEEATIKQDVGRVLLALESEQEKLIGQSGRQEPEVPVMTDAERTAALEFLKDPQLMDRILADYDACGLVGEETNKLVCYLACVSRLMPRPLSVLIQSSSGAGKTTLQDAVLRFMPPEQQVRLSALTAQSLYYMGRDQLKHKILAVAEEEGLAQAAYALKLLQSEGRISIACAGRDADTGRQHTELHEVEGPVAALLTTTAERPDEELANRGITLRTNEHPEQTTAINHRQRAAYAGRRADSESDSPLIEQRHHNAQRLLEPLGVVIPWAEQLTFRADRIGSRRDNAKYLALIASITLLHQYQRKRTTRSGHSQVVATLDDVELANRLATATMARSFDSLMPQTRRLLTLLSEYVAKRSQGEEVALLDIRFTQRELRDVLEWNDRTLRRHLGRLVELEHVVAYRSGRGNGRTYQLVDAAASDSPTTASLGLVDPRELRSADKSPRG